ncbi:MAG TPA: hypothetical protein VJZ94_04045 [Candidatus Paceibacterota bacterium]|nr:hypothetical protein [Candidatus Paceibacterota bacterium]
MKVSLMLASVIFVSSAFMLFGCEGERVTVEQYEQRRYTAEALFLAQKGDLIVLSDGRVCGVKDNPKTSAFIKADCGNGSPSWKYRLEIAHYVLRVISSRYPSYAHYAAQYTKQR